MPDTEEPYGLHDQRLAMLRQANAAMYSGNTELLDRIIRAGAGMDPVTLGSLQAMAEDPRLNSRISPERVAQSVEQFHEWTANRDAIGEFALEIGARPDDFWAAYGHRTAQEQRQHQASLDASIGQQDSVLGMAGAVVNQAAGGIAEGAQSVIQAGISGVQAPFSDQSWAELYQERMDPIQASIENAYGPAGADLASQIVRGVGRELPFIVPGMAAGRMAAVGARQLLGRQLIGQLGVRALPAFAAVAGQGVFRLPERVNQLKAEGMPDSEAFIEAMKQTGIDAGISGIFASIPGVQTMATWMSGSNVGKATARAFLGRVGMTIAGQVPEELLQTLASNVRLVMREAERDGLPISIIHALDRATEERFHNDYIVAASVAAVLPTVTMTAGSGVSAAMHQGAVRRKAAAQRKGKADIAQQSRQEATQQAAPATPDAAQQTAPDAAPRSPARATSAAVADTAAADAARLNERVTQNTLDNAESMPATQKAAQKDAPGLNLREDSKRDTNEGAMATAQRLQRDLFKVAESTITVQYSNRPFPGSKAKTIALAKYDAKKNTIRLHPALKNAGVPQAVRDAVIAHELAHAQQVVAGDAMEHDARFTDMLAQLENGPEALAWLQEHLDNFAKGRTVTLTSRDGAPELQIEVRPVVGTSPEAREVGFTQRAQQLLGEQAVEGVPGLGQQEADVAQRQAETLRSTGVEAVDGFITRVEQQVAAKRLDAGAPEVLGSDFVTLCMLADPTPAESAAMSAPNPTAAQAETWQAFQRRVQRVTDVRDGVASIFGTHLRATVDQVNRPYERAMHMLSYVTPEQAALIKQRQQKEGLSDEQTAFMEMEENRKRHQNVVDLLKDTVNLNYDALAEYQSEKTGRTVTPDNVDLMALYADRHSPLWSDPAVARHMETLALIANTSFTERLGGNLGDVINTLIINNTLSVLSVAGSFTSAVIMTRLERLNLRTQGIMNAIYKTVKGQHSTKLRTWAEANAARATEDQNQRFDMAKPSIGERAGIVFASMFGSITKGAAAFVSGTDPVLAALHGHAHHADVESDVLMRQIGTPSAIGKLFPRHPKLRIAMELLQRLNGGMDAFLNSMAKDAFVRSEAMYIARVRNMSEVDADAFVQSQITNVTDATLADRIVRLTQRITAKTPFNQDGEMSRALHAVDKLRLLRLEGLGGYRPLQTFFPFFRSIARLAEQGFRLAPGTNLLALASDAIDARQMLNRHAKAPLAEQADIALKVTEKLNQMSRQWANLVVGSAILGIFGAILDDEQVENLKQGRTPGLLGDSWDINFVGPLNVLNRLVGHTIGAFRGTSTVTEVGEDAITIINDLPFFADRFTGKGRTAGEGFFSEMAKYLGRSTVPYNNLLRGMINMVDPRAKRRAMFPWNHNGFFVDVFGNDARRDTGIMASVLETGGVRILPMTGPQLIWANLINRTDGVSSDWHRPPADLTPEQEHAFQVATGREFWRLLNTSGINPSSDLSQRDITRIRNMRTRARNAGTRAARAAAPQGE